MDPILITQHVDIARASQEEIYFDGTLGDVNAHKWIIDVVNGGTPVSFTGATVAANVLRDDGVTVYLEGVASGNEAYVIFTQECYAVDGVVRASMTIAKDGATITHAICTGLITRRSTDVLVVPGTPIPSVATLIAILEGYNDVIADAGAATGAAIEATNAANAAEALRVTAENGRVSAETARGSAESARASAETARASAETARAGAETSRASAETARASAESGRVTAENGRVSAESGRVSAENTRVTESAAAVYAANLAAQAATIASNNGAALNMLFNSAFYGGMAGYYLYQSQYFARDLTKKLFGANSVKGTITGLSSDGGNAVSILPDYAIPCASGNTYTFSAYVLYDDYTTFEGNSLKTSLVVLNAAKNTTLQFQEVIHTPVIANNGKWVRITNTFAVTHADAAYIRVYMVIIRNGTCYFACPKLELGSVATDYRPSWADIMAITFPARNASIASQAGFSSDTYLTGSFVQFPSAPVAGTRYKLTFDVTKTAAGTGAPAITIRIGTAGTTADAARGVITFGAGSAAVDSGVFEVIVVFRSVGGSTSAIVQSVARLVNNLAATGLSSAVKEASALSTGFDSTVAGLGIGASYNGGASAAHTVQLVSAEVII